MTVFWVKLVIDQPQTRASGVDRQGRRHGPSVHQAGSLSSSQPGGPSCWTSLLAFGLIEFDHIQNTLRVASAYMYSIKPESRNPGRILISFHTKSQATGAVALRPVTGQRTYYGRQVISTILAAPQRKIWAKFCLWNADNLLEQKRTGGQFHYIAPLTL